MAAFSPNQLNKTVSNAGTRLQFTTASPTMARLVIIQANAGNAGTLYIGTSAVSSSVYGVALPKGASLVIGNDLNDPRIDLSQLYADTSNSGDGFSVLYF